MERYWIGVACKEHVQNAVAAGFAQLCHGKSGPFNRMREGDWLIYYSPSTKFGGKEPLQAFTAIGNIQKGSAYPVHMYDGFTPWRREVSFLQSVEVPIRPLLENLSFIKDKQRWGLPFRSGCLEIPKNDFQYIALAMAICL